MHESSNRREFLKTSAAAAAGAAVGSLSIAPSADAAGPGANTYKIVGACNIKADVHWATGGVTNRPAVMWLHGGALIFGSRWNIGGIDKSFITRLVKQGFVVVSIDYRLAPETKLPGIIEDVQDAWRWLHKSSHDLGIDPKRIATAGGSAGGYLTLTTGFCLNPRPRALAAFYGYGDITTPWYSEPYEFYRRGGLISRAEALKSVTNEPLCEEPGGNSRGRFYMYCRQQGIWPKEVAGHDPKAEPKWFDPYCPIRNVTAKYPPTFMAHGTDDKDVPYEESKNMNDQLAKASVAHELMTIPGAGHGFAGAKPEVLGRIVDRAVDFVRAHTI
jgi:acetyl esterase/lipase